MEFRQENLKISHNLWSNPITRVKTRLLNRYGDNKNKIKIRGEKRRFEERDARDKVRGTRSEMRDARFEVRDSRCEERDARCEMRGARCEMRDARFGVRDSGCEMWGARDEVRDASFRRRHACLARLPYNTNHAYKHITNRRCWEAQNWQLKADGSLNFTPTPKRRNGFSRE